MSGRCFSSTENRPRPWLCMDRQRDRLLHGDLGHCGSGSPCRQLVDLVAWRSGDRGSASPRRPARTPTARRPSCRRTAASTGRNDTRSGRRLPRTGKNTRPATIATVSHGEDMSRDAVAVPVREAEEQEDRRVGEHDVPLQRHRERERRDDEQVEHHHERHRGDGQPRFVENSRTSGATISTTVPPTCAMKLGELRRAHVVAGSRGSAPA